MKSYTVSYLATASATVTVEAEDEAEAVQKADEHFVAPGLFGGAA